MDSRDCPGNGQRGMLGPRGRRPRVEEPEVLGCVPAEHNVGTDVFLTAYPGGTGRVWSPTVVPLPPAMFSIPARSQGTWGRD
jgi:hypothetical protein